MRYIVTDSQFRNIGRESRLNTYLLVRKLLEIAAQIIEIRGDLRRKNVFLGCMVSSVSRAAWIFLGVSAIAYCVATLAIASVSLSGGTLVLWPVDGLILGLMLGGLRRRPWLVMVAGLAGALLAFAVVGKQMTLAYSRIGLMAIAIPCTYLLARRLIRERGIAEPRALLPFLLACAFVGVPTAFARALLLHTVWGFPLIPLTLTTATATFTGCALLTPLILLMSSAESHPQRKPIFRLAEWCLVLGFTLGTAWAFQENRYPVAFLMPVALILIAHVVDFTGIVVVILAATFISAGLTLFGYGPVAHFRGTISEKIFIIQGFIVTMICAALPLSALMTDNSNLKRSLIAALNGAMAASQAKSTFLATVSHEIRTPLNGVLGMAQAMELDELTPVQRERIAIVRSSGESLLSLLNDVLDLSKIEAGRMTIESVEFELDHVIDQVLNNNSALAAAKGLTIESDTTDASGSYKGDPNRVRQIIQNLVSNALKFTEIGGVTVSATYASGWLEVRAQDTGIGIPADRIHVLFERFAQADDSTTRRFGGTGLGLSICRELAQAMGGDISVESIIGVGSTFILRLPIARLRLAQTQARSIDPARPTAPEIGLRVLAAEDNPTNQIVLGTLMAAAGVTPTIVSNGEEAVAAWRSGSWDVILMDIHMPLMDGPTAVREIRAAEALEGRPPTTIIAVTANAMDHQVREYMAFGMDGHISKPIRAAELFAVLAAIQSEIEGGSAISDATLRAETPGTHSPRKGVAA